MRSIVAVPERVYLGSPAGIKTERPVGTVRVSSEPHCKVISPSAMNSALKLLPSNVHAWIPLRIHLST